MADESSYHLNSCRSLEMRKIRDWKGKPGAMHKARRMLLFQQKVFVRLLNY